MPNGAMFPQMLPAAIRGNLLGRNNNSNTNINNNTSSNRLSMNHGDYGMLIAMLLFFNFPLTSFFLLAFFKTLL